MRLAVQLPPSEELNEWLAVNSELDDTSRERWQGILHTSTRCQSPSVDFFNEVSLLYGIVADDAAQFEHPGEGFPPGFEYLWAPEIKGKTGRKS
ncbi:unnamed protein product [Choristocarpus tenellus]